METPPRSHRKPGRPGVAPLIALLMATLALPATGVSFAGEREQGDPQPAILQARPIRTSTTPLQPREDPTALMRQLRPGGADYRIGEQDLLEIKVFDVEELDQVVRVAGDGSITMPLLGRLEVAGLTKTEVEEMIAALLADQFVRDPQVTVFIKEYESRKVAVSGAVREPGTYEMLGDKTLLEMVSMAGGLDKELGEEIIIFRRNETGTERIAVDLDRLVYRADPEVNIDVLPGDIIYVPTIELMRIFVSGAVNSPDLYEVPRNEPVTLLKAMALAGGTTDRAALSRVKIMRTDDTTGVPVSIVVNLKKIRRGKEDDPMLQPDDIVLVPEAFF